MAFVDDLAILVMGKHNGELPRKANKIINNVSEALENKKLPLAPENREWMFLTGNRKVEDIEIIVQEVKINNQKDCALGFT